MIQRIARQSLVGLAIMLVLLFVPAGTLAWPAAWIFLLEFGIASILITRWLLRRRRQKPCEPGRQGMPPPARPW